MRLDFNLHHLLDARSLKGLAHPIRMRMLNLLQHDGPATASQLAARIGESTGSTSYHLRRLAAHGFIEDAPEHGKGRERWWRAVTGGIGMDESLYTHPDPTVRDAVNVFVGATVSNHAQETAEWLDTDWPDAWKRKADFSDYTLRLTPDLLDELNAKLHALVNSYRDLELSEDTGHPTPPERVRVHLHCFPQKPVTYGEPDGTGEPEGRPRR